MTQENLTALDHLARFVANAKVSPASDAQALVCDAVIDTFGCILLGATQPVSQKARTATVTLGLTDGPATIFGTGQNAPPATAAFLNAVAGHCLDFDDWEIPGNTHPTVVMLPALLATANTKTSGAELVKAYTIGFELIARLGEALNFDHYDRGWHTTSTLGALGTTAAVARLNRLDTQQTAHALSIAVSRASGYTCQFGTDCKAMQAGFAAETGVIAYALARSGMTGQTRVFDHPRGMAALTSNVAKERLTLALGRFGKPLALEQHGLVLKPWPSCGYTHRIMDCALQLAEYIEHSNEIECIEIHLPDFHAAILPFKQPKDRREALFSLPFVAAMGLLHKNLTIEDLDRESWTHPQVAKLIACCRVHPFKPSRPELNYDPREPDRMEVSLTNDRVVSSECAYPLGAPQNPMSSEQVFEKFCRNAGSELTKYRTRLQNWQYENSVTGFFEEIGASA